MDIPIETSSWKSHKGEILCLDLVETTRRGEGTCLLASGSEDSSVRIWDCQRAKVIKCFYANRNSVYEFEVDDDGDEEHSSSNPQIIIRRAKASLPSLTQDDINQMAIHHKSGGRYLAVADDSGRVTLLDTSSSPPRPYRILSSTRQNEDMCTSVQFRPRVNWDLACGFHACTVGLWDFSRARCRYISTMDTEEDGINTSSSDEEEEEEEELDHAITPTSRLFNPPYVNGLSFSPNGRYLAVAQGDGELSIYDYASEKKVAALRGGHSTGIAQACFLTDSLLASVGNDRVLCLWECEVTRDRKTSAAAVAAADATTAVDSSRRPRLLKRLTDLPGKPNWMVATTASCCNPTSAIRIFIASTTNEIAVLTLPAP